jgi:hypothetical protein
VAKRPATEKELTVLRAHAYKKGQSGNPSGLSKSYMEVARLCRDLATSPAAFRALKRILNNGRNPRLQMVAWEQLMLRGFGAPVQAVVLEQKLRYDAPQTDGGFTRPASYVIDANDPQQLARAVEVARGLDKLARLVDEVKPLPEPRDVTGNTLPEAVAALPPAPEPRKVVEMGRGPERFNGAGGAA